MLQVVSTGAYYPPVDTTWKILTTGASQLTAGALCTGEGCRHGQDTIPMVAILSAGVSRQYLLHAHIATGLIFSVGPLSYFYPPAK